MECNRAEAERAKEMAEKKFDTKDYMGAKRLAMKAQNLFPGLSGISQMLAVLEVYISAEKKINGEADWYGILGVDPTADDETLKKKYRKLALILHPDKNSSSGAEESFKLISDAWNLLADKAKRAAYDQKIRNVRLHSNVPSTLAPGFPTQRTNYSAANSQTTTTHEASFSTPAPPDKTKTFWTKCSNCSKKYDYPLIYLHQFVCCPDCRHRFLALDILAVRASNQFTPSNLSEQRPKRKYKTAANRGKSNTGISSAAASAVSRRLSEYCVGNSNSCSAAYTPSVDHMAQTAQSLHAFNQASGASTSGYANNAAKRRCKDGVGVSRYGNNAKSHMDRGAGEASSEPLRGNATSNTMFTSNDDISGGAAQNILKEKTKKEMNEGGSSAAVQMAKNGNERGQSSGDSDVQCEGNLSSRGKKVVETENIDTEKAMTSTNVPDADFHNFDENRTEKSFEENQVWAAYDEEDGMPRYYAKILSIISTSPLTMRISWLNAKTSKESPNWVSPGCSQTCGEFKVGKAVISENALNSFSHRVCWTKISARIVSIYPKKGEIWAVYKYWSRDWNESTKDKVKHKYQIVEVVQDYNVKGVVVISLAKVTDFKSVFRQPFNPKSYIRRIPREEMCRFSHQVPAHLLTGEEGPNALRGCWELDPAAISVDLILKGRSQMLKDEETVKIAENFLKDAKDSHDTVRES